LGRFFASETPMEVSIRTNRIAATLGSLALLVLAQAVAARPRISRSSAPSA
jgi:hypothetical protein